MDAAGMLYTIMFVDVLQFITTIAFYIVAIPALKTLYWDGEKLKFSKKYNDMLVSIMYAYYYLFVVGLFVDFMFAVKYTIPVPLLHARVVILLLLQLLTVFLFLLTVFKIERKALYFMFKYAREHCKNA